MQCIVTDLEILQLNFIMYLHNAIVAVNILQIALLKMPLEYFGQANLMV